MRYHSAFWPWRVAYATGGRGCTNRSNTAETRWHHDRGASFGVRRPLRYLAHRLDLDDPQMRRMASVLNHLKNEREQAALDEKRSVSAIAELLANGTPTLDECRATLSARTDAAERMKEETAKAIVTISELLDDDQREEFIELMLTGSFTL